MPNWQYNHDALPRKITTIDDFPEEVIGFIYRITHVPTGKYYIGKKVLFHRRKSKISQREKKTTGTRKKFKQTIKESDWLTYWGSSQELLLFIEQEGHENFTREILAFAYSVKQLSYMELEMQIKMDVLRKETFNHNVAGKYYRKDLMKDNE